MVYLSRRLLYISFEILIALHVIETFDTVSMLISPARRHLLSVAGFKCFYPSSFRNLEAADTANRFHFRFQGTVGDEYSDMIC